MPKQKQRQSQTRRAPPRKSRCYIVPGDSKTSGFPRVLTVLHLTTLEYSPGSRFSGWMILPVGNKVASADWYAPGSSSSVHDCRGIRCLALRSFPIAGAARFSTRYYLSARGFQWCNEQSSRTDSPPSIHAFQASLDKISRVTITTLCSPR